MRLHRALLSDKKAVRALRKIYGNLIQFSVPAPRVIFRPLLYLFLALRSSWYFVKRVFFCEPLFKAYCASYGRNLHTDVFLHWVQGGGDIHIGNNVTLDGKISFLFAARYSESPTLEIGDNTGIGHNCTLIVGKRITIGRDCRIAAGVKIFDSPGHPLDPVARREGKPAQNSEVRPIFIGNNVWIGMGASIFPGVTIGDNSVIGTGAVVTSDVPAGVVVLGNPARKVMSVQAPPPAPAPEDR